MDGWTFVGNTPLMRAVENGHYAVVELLLSAAKQRSKPIAKRRNAKGETALHKAAATGTHPNIGPLFVSSTHTFSNRFSR